MREIINLFMFSLAVSGVLCISAPVYQNNNNQYTAQALPEQIVYKQPQQYKQTVPVYEGLQSYSTQVQNQPQIALANVERQRPVHISPQYQTQLAAQAQEAFAAAAQAKISASQAVPRPVQYVQPQQQVRYVTRPKAEPVQYRSQKLEESEEQKEDYDPNPSYQFGFDVKDDLYTNYQNRKEQREGNKITGSYSVVDSDGFIRTVSYTADPKEGFKAEVTRQPTDIVVKIPKPQPQFQQPVVPRQQLQYVQEAPQPRHHQEQKHQQSNVIYQYQ